MKAVKDIILLTRRPFIQNMHNPTWLFVSASTPLMYLILFMPLLKKLAGPSLGTSDVIQLFLPGIVALLAFGSSNFAGFGTIWELKSGLIERLRVTPSSRLAILIGPILSSTAWTFITSTVIILLSVPFGFHIHVLGLLVYAFLLVLIMMLFSSLSVAIAILTKEMSTFAAVINGFNLPLILLAGVMLPLTLAPRWMRFIAHINPLYYAVNAGRLLANGTIHASTVEQAFYVLIPLTLLVVFWSLRVYRKAVA